MSSKDYKQHMKQVRKDFKEKYGYYPGKEPKVKKLPKKERKELEVYAIKSHYGNYEVRQRDAVTGKPHGSKWDEVFKTKKDAVNFRNERANELSKKGHSVKNDKTVYY